MRVLHCPTDVGGNAWPLSRAERELGIQSDVMVMEASHYAFQADVILARTGQSHRLIRELKRWFFLLRNFRHYDLFHFNGGQSFFTYPRLGIFYFDLPLLRALGKTIVMTFNGCDIRFPSQCGACAHNATPCRSERTERLRHRRSELAKRYTDYLFVTTPDLKRSLPTAEWRPQTRFMIDELKLSGNVAYRREPGPFRIAHAPTRRVKKGTDVIERVVEGLRQEGMDVDLHLIEGVPHYRATEIIRNADVVVDQLYIGWYGGVSVEGMALARPVICYIKPDFFDLAPPQVRAQLPIISSTAVSLKSKLRELLENPEQCFSLGQQGRAYFETWHDPRKVAARTVEVYRALIGSK